jgi:hypothetical protein
MKPQYCAVIGDINKSRSLPRRNKVQEKFKEAVKTINKEFKNDIASKFLVTLGDEFQGLLINPSSCYKIIQRFQDMMEPVPFSFGVGIGVLSTPLNPKEAIGMDGECFHRARTAVQKAKKDKQEVVFDFHDPSLPIINALVKILHRQKQLLRSSEKKILRLREKNLSQLIIAKRLRVTQQAVSKVIKNAPLVEIEESVDALNNFFYDFGKNELPK